MMYPHTKNVEVHKIDAISIWQCEQALNIVDIENIIHL